MRVLIHEFASGGGLAGQEVSPTLVLEGSAMLRALLADLTASGRNGIVTTADPRFPVAVPRGVDVVTLSEEGDRALDALILSVDAVWLVAPETGGWLAGLAARTERLGTRLLGSGATAIRRASDKAGLEARLSTYGIATPETYLVRRDSGMAAWNEIAHRAGYPVVVKLRRGAGCEGVSLARDVIELERSVELVRHAGTGRGALLLQRYIGGHPASVSLLSDGRSVFPLTLNQQQVELVEASGTFTYSGGVTPFEHPLSARAFEVAVGTCRALGGLRGYLGVDVVLTETDAVVIEVNPRLTTSYLGVREALAGEGVPNVAELAIMACDGVLPEAISIWRHVRFDSDGSVVSRTRFDRDVADAGRPVRA